MNLIAVHINRKTKNPKVNKIFRLQVLAITFPYTSCIKVHLPLGVKMTETESVQLHQ